MKKKVVILTLSEKWKKKCIVAFDREEKKLLRLVSSPENGDGIPLKYVNDIQLLDEVEIDVISSCPLEHQTENIFINLEFGLQKTGIIVECTLLDIYKNIDTTIFGDTDYKIDSVTDLSHSIEIVKFTEMYFENNGVGNKMKTKVRFNCQHKNYSLTDSRYYCCDRSIRSGYVVISLPLSDDYTREGNGYYKFISAIYEDTQ